MDGLSMVGQICRITSDVTKQQEEKMGSDYKPEGLLLSPDRPHPLKLLQPPKTASPAGSQVFNHMKLWRTPDARTKIVSIGFRLKGDLRSSILSIVRCFL